LAVLLPKCPLCLVALLSWLGLGAALAKQLAPWLHGLAWAIAMCAIAGGVAAAVVRLRGRTQRCAREHPSCSDRAAPGC
jgi:membrane protein implicated in regulation of membrane protease activity